MATDPPRPPHPLSYFLLILPYGASFGYVSVALPYLAKQHGVSTEAIAGVISAALVPHGIKFLWAPLVDTTLSKRAWYVIALAMVILGTIASSAMPITPTTMGALTAVVVASQVGLTLMGMACENFLAFNVPDAGKGRATGWYQAGALLGTGVGGGLALKLAEVVPQPWMTGAIVGALMLFAAAPLPFLREPPITHTLLGSMQQLLRDLWSMVRSRSGLLGIFVSLSPVGAGAASNFFAPMSAGWGASAGLVELVNGWLGGVMAPLGAWLGGLASDRMERRNAYALGGALTALTSVAFVLLPRNEWSYGVLVLVYAVFNAWAFAAFSGFVMATVGQNAVATKYNLFASFANLATSYTIKLLGKADTRWHTEGVLWGDAALTFTGIAVLLLLGVVLGKPSGPAPSPAPPAA